VDVVVSDIRLPGNSGMDLLQWIRDKQLHLQVVMMTALRSGKDFAEAYNAGARDYIVKPFTLQALLQKVEANLPAAPRPPVSPAAESGPAE